MTDYYKMEDGQRVKMTKKETEEYLAKIAEMEEARKRAYNLTNQTE